MYPKISVLGNDIPTYSICCAMGLLGSISLLLKMLLQKLLVKKYINIFIFSLIGLFSGARLFGIYSKLVTIYYDTGVWNFSESMKSGIVYFGGLFGYLLTLKLLCWAQKKEWKEIRNITAVIIPLFHMFGRIGCFFGGCCYGKISNSKIAFHYAVALQTDTPEKRIPVQLMEAGFELLLFVILFYQYQRKNEEKAESRDLLKEYLVSYAIWRFVIEFFRGDDVRGVFHGISFSQIGCILILFLWLIHFLRYEVWRVENGK